MLYIGEFPFNGSSLSYGLELQQLTSMALIAFIKKMSNPSGSVFDELYIMFDYALRGPMSKPTDVSPLHTGTTNATFSKRNLLNGEIGGEAVHDSTLN